MQLSMKRVLTLEAAMEIVAAATAEAARMKCPCVVAVVDDAGWLLALQRMDEAPMLASIELAPGKARAAALFRKPTQALESAINGGRYHTDHGAPVHPDAGGPSYRGGRRGGWCHRGFCRYPGARSGNRRCRTACRQLLSAVDQLPCAPMLARCCPDG